MATCAHVGNEPAAKRQDKKKSPKKKPMTGGLFKSCRPATETVQEGTMNSEAVDER